MTPAAFLDALKAAADAAEAAEAKFRREIAERTKALDRERAFAFRRLNFMRAIADAVASAESEEIAVDVASQADNAQFGVAQFRDRLDNGRKVAIQILEFFDRHGVTLRRGDLRRINKHRLDLFRSTSGENKEPQTESGREASLVGRPDFKSGKGRETVLGGFDSLSLPPRSRGVR